MQMDSGPIKQMIKAAHDHVRTQSVTHLLEKLQSRQGQATGANAIQHSTPPQGMDTSADARVCTAEQLLQEHPHDCPQQVHGGNKNGLCASTTYDPERGQAHVSSMFDQLQFLSLHSQRDGKSGSEVD